MCVWLQGPMCRCEAWEPCTGTHLRLPSQCMGPQLHQRLYLLDWVLRQLILCSSRGKLDTCIGCLSLVGQSMLEALVPEHPAPVTPRSNFIAAYYVARIASIDAASEACWRPILRGRVLPCAKELAGNFT